MRYFGGNLAIRGSGSATERLRAFVRARVHKDGALYERGAAVKLAAYLQKPSSWVSHYVDVPPQRNADLDTAWAICAFYGVDLSEFLAGTPAAPPAPTPLTRYEARVLRLVRMMDVEGQKLAAQSIAGFVRAFPRQPPTPRPAQLPQTGAGTMSRVRGTRKAAQG